MENVGVKLVRQAGAKTNDLAGDGSTTSIILAQGLIAEGVKVCMNMRHYIACLFWIQLRNTTCDLLRLSMRIFHKV